MKSFRKFITENIKEEAFPVSDADKKKLQRQARPETSSLSSQRIRRGLDTARKPLSSDEIIGLWKSAKSTKPSVVATSSKPESGVYFGSSKKAIKTAQEQEKRQQVKDTLLKNQGGSAELQAAQSSGPEETMVGKRAEPGTGKKYRQATRAVEKPKGVKQAEVSKALKSRRAELERKRAAVNKPPTAAQLKTFKKGRVRGYIGQSGVPTAKGIQTYATRSVTRGYGDADYNPSKRGVKNPGQSAKTVDDLVSRAAAGDKPARSKVRKTYKSMTSRYRDIVPQTARREAAFKSLEDARRSALERAFNAPAAQRPPSAGGTAPSSSKPSSGTGSGRGGSGSTPTQPSTSQGGTATLTKTKTSQTLNLGTPPTTQAPSKPTGAARVTSSQTNFVQPPAKPSPTKPTGAARVTSSQTNFVQPPAKPSPTKPQSQGQKMTFRDLRTQTGFTTSRRGSYSYKPSSPAVKGVKGALRGIGRVAGPAAAIADVGLSYKDARDAGYSKRQSVKRTAAQVGAGTAGGWAGAKAGLALGAKIGSFLGPKGALIGGALGGIAGGIAGYAGARGLATKVLNKTMKPPAQRPRVNQQQVQNTANNLKNKQQTASFKLNKAGTAVVVDNPAAMNLVTKSQYDKIVAKRKAEKANPKPRKNTFSMKTFEEFVLETSDAMLKSGYTIDETIQFWTLEDEELAEKVISSLTLTESVSYDSDLYAVCEGIGALTRIAPWALRQAGKLKGLFGRSGTTTITRSQTRGGLFNTGFMKRVFGKPKTQVTGRNIPKPPRKPLGTAGKIAALGTLGLGLGVATKNILDAEKGKGQGVKVEDDPTKDIIPNPNSDPNTMDAYGWWKKSHAGRPVSKQN